MPADPLPGVFETLLVVDGRPIAALAHLERLGRSLHELYGVRPPAGLAEQLAACAVPLAARQRLRVDAVPFAGEIRIDYSASPLPAGPPTPVACRTVVVPGGLGAHKLRDRRRLDGLTDPGLTPLLMDADGDVLEAAWGNVWLREGDRLVTPPPDGRLLPGVTRARLLALLPRLGFTAVQERVSLDRLGAADAVFLSSALRLAVAAVPPAAPAPAVDDCWLVALSSALADAG